MIWTHTVSVLFDQETARLCDDGGARMCIDVTQISFAHHRWGRARCSANVRSRRWRGPGSQLPAAAPRFMNCWSHADPGGRAVLLHIGSNLLALRRNFFISGEQVRVKHNFVWEFRVHYLAVVVVVLCELIQEGNTRLKLLTSCTKLQCVLLISCTVNLTSHFLINFILFQV